VGGEGITRIFQFQNPAFSNAKTQICAHVGSRLTYTSLSHIYVLLHIHPCPQFIVVNIQNANTFSPACQGNTTFAMPCETVEETCRSRPSLIAFFLRAHHNVDSHNKPCKPLWSREQAFDAFAFQLNFCATGVVYGEYPLCRSESDDACVNLRTAPPCGTIVPPPTN